MFDLKKFLLILKNNNSWIKLSALIFFGSFFLGYIGAAQNLDFIQEFSAPYFDFLEDLAEEVVDSSPLRGIFLLFLNNFLASLRVLFLGIILGIAPFLSLLVNGSILGIVTAILAEQNINPVFFLSLGILPHGILEIPAFLISAAFGLKLGYHLIYPIEGKNRRKSISYILNEVLNIFFFIFILLVLAAIIEILITPFLISILFI